MRNQDKKSLDIQTSNAISKAGDFLIWYMCVCEFYIQIEGQVTKRQKLYYSTYLKNLE